MRSADLRDVMTALASGDGHVVIDPPGEGDGYWAGAPSVTFRDGTWWLAYRLRSPVDRGRGFANVVARSEDGLRFENIATIRSADMQAASLERPSLVARPDGGWRLYVSCSTWGSKHWWVEALDADDPAGLPDGTRTMVLPGSSEEAWKDVVVSADAGWQMWACRHPLDGGDDEADRMSTWYATSDDGLGWTMRSEALAPGTGWDRRGARVAAVLPEADGSVQALYDGRASAAENWFERTGLATGAPGALTGVEGPLPATFGRALRYVSVAEDATGLRVFYEQTRDDGAHELRTVYVPRPVAVSQSV